MADRMGVVLGMIEELIPYEVKKIEFDIVYIWSALGVYLKAEVD